MRSRTYTVVHLLYTELIKLLRELYAVLVNSVDISLFVLGTTFPIVADSRGERRSRPTMSFLSFGSSRPHRRSNLHGLRGAMV